MAGIGFQLRRLSDEDNLLAPMASIGHAAIIATGPWIFTVTALQLITSFSSRFIPVETLGGFRLVIIYSFALSLVVTAPVVIVAARMVGDAIYLKAYHRIKPLYVAALLLSGCGAGAVALLVYIMFGLPLKVAMSGSSCCGLVALIWVGLSFCGAVRDYVTITFGFITGLAVAVVGAVATARSVPEVAAIIYAFDCGLVIIVCTLTSRILTTFPHPMGDPIKPLQALCHGIRRFWLLALGGFISALAIWADKWVVWSGPAGERHALGLFHAPFYDSAMFTACLVAIPALALFVTHIETAFFEKHHAYYKAIRNHATLRQIEQIAAQLSQETFRSISNITLIQAAICCMAVLVAPSLIEVAGLQYRQIGILRFGILGSLFQFVFFASTSLLLFFERYAHFLALQTTFLVLQVVLTAISVRLGPAYYGTGNLIACLSCGLLAAAVLERTLKNLTYNTFRSASRQQSGKIENDLLEFDQRQRRTTGGLS